VKAIRDVGMRLRQVAEEEGYYERSGVAIADGRPLRGRDLPKDELMRLVKDLESQMKEAAKQLEFEKAAALRDEVVELRGLLVLQAGPGSLDSPGGSLDGEEGVAALEREAGPPRTAKRVMRGRGRRFRR